MSRGWPLALLLLPTGIVMVAIFVMSGRLKALTGHGILDLAPGFNLEIARQVFDSYSDDGFALHARIRALDFFYPLLYGLALAVFLRRFWPGARWPLILPALAVLFDFGENFVLSRLAITYPDLSAGLVTAGSGLGVAKFSALTAAGLTLGLGALAADAPAGALTGQSQPERAGAGPKARMVRAGPRCAGPGILAVGVACPPPGICRGPPPRPGAPPE